LSIFKFIDIATKQPVENVYIRVIDDGNNKLYSYLSNKEGTCRVMLKNKSARSMRGLVELGES